MHKEIIKSSSLNDKKIDSISYDYYLNRENNKKDFGFIGPIINGVDVGNLRYEDHHLNFPLIDLTTTNILTKELSFGEYKAKWYCPENVSDLRPTVFYFHGGGFVSGSVYKCELPIKRLSELINGVVVSVDYTLSPEASYPTALEQCYDCLERMIKDNKIYNIDPNKIIVFGDSAGANIAAALCLKDKNNKYIKMQVLLYPELDLTRSFTDKIDKNLFGKDIDEFAWNKIKSMIDKFELWDNSYLQHNEDRKDELISPLFACNYSNFPSTIILCSQYDYFTLESEVFANKLDEANVDVNFYIFEGCFHGFLERLGLIEQSDKSLKIIADFIKKI